MGYAERLARVAWIVGLVADGFACACGPDGAFHIADSGHFRIRRVDASGTIATVVGNGFFGEPVEGAAGTQTPLGFVRVIAFGPDGRMYFSDGSHHAVFRWDPISDVMERYAGSGADGVAGDGGAAVAAAVGNPAGIALDGQCNLYIAQDKPWGVIRRVDAADGTITTVAGGFASLSGLAHDGVGTLYASEWSENRVWMVDPATGAKVVAVGAEAANAVLATPRGLAVDAQGRVLIADSGNGRVVRHDPATGQVEEIVAGLPEPSAAEPHPASGIILVATLKDGRVRRFDPATGSLAIVAGIGTAAFTGDGGPATQATLSAAQDVARGADGALYVADTGNGRVRRIGTGGVIATVAGGGTEEWVPGVPATAAKAQAVARVAAAPDGTLWMLVLGVPGFGDSVWTLDLAAGTLDLRYVPASGARFPADVAVGPDGAAYVVEFDKQANPPVARLLRIQANGTVMVADSAASRDLQLAVAVDGARRVYWSAGPSQPLRRLDPQAGAAETLAL
jgi:streptogramin lyase